MVQCFEKSEEQGTRDTRLHCNGGCSQTKENCGCSSASSVHGMCNDDESEAARAYSLVQRIASVILGVGYSRKKANLTRGGY